MRIKRPSRRLTFILIAVVVVLLAGIYIWQSVAAWTGYERRLTTEKAAYERLQADAATGSADDRLRAIRELDDKLSHKGDICGMNALYAWQASVVPVLRDGVATCRAAVKRLDMLAPPVSALRDYLDTADKLKGIVTSLVPPGALTEKNWVESGSNKAKAADESIRKLTTQDMDAKRLIDQAKSLSDQLSKAWGTLLSANEAKDKTAFLGASAGVVKAYADFAGLADTADTGIAKKVDAARKALASPTKS